MLKLALLIGVSKYESGLAPLVAANRDVEAMQQVLGDPEIGGFDEVKPLINPERQVMEEAIFSLFANREKDDLVLLYFSGHGIKDDSGNLYLASCNTRKEQEKLVQPTAVAASYVQNTMSDSRSKRQVVILDCCFSGAFSQGMKVKDDGSIPIKQQLGGEGRAILTSSTSTQYSFEHPGFELSLYTHFLFEGLKTGVADLDSDGNISIDELHIYASEKVQETAPGKMKPEFYPVKEGYKILLAKVRINDPKLEYRKVVERYVINGEFPKFTRKLLDLKKDNLKISFSEARIIENEVIKPYREYNAKLKDYQEMLSEAIQHFYPLDNSIINDFKLIEQDLGLREKNAVKIQQKIIAKREVGFLISLATSIFEKLGFEEYFIKSKGVYPPYVAYKFRQPREDNEFYQLVLLQRNDGLDIYLLKEVLNISLLKIKCWEYNDFTREADTLTKGIFLILPSKTDIFLDSLHPVYADFFKGKVQGDFSLNRFYQDEYGEEECTKPKFSLVEFPFEIMSNRRDSYLVVSDNELFTNTWKISIRSREVLEEVIDYLFQQMTIQGLLQPLSSPIGNTENPPMSSS
ncbi:MAG: caspase family protein [Nostoc sp.]|uniref:caspase family protein n=1 Tax=Nostoc sp. TaxID=1180 RepID=UPI002FF91A50